MYCIALQIFIARNSFLTNTYTLSPSVTIAAYTYACIGTELELTFDQVWCFKINTVIAVFY